MSELVLVNATTGLGMTISLLVNSTGRTILNETVVALLNVALLGFLLNETSQNHQPLISNGAPLSSRLPLDISTVTTFRTVTTTKKQSITSNNFVPNTLLTITTPSTRPSNSANGTMSATHSNTRPGPPLPTIPINNRNITNPAAPIAGIPKRLPQEWFYVQILYLYLIYATVWMTLLFTSCFFIWWGLQLLYYGYKQKQKRMTEELVQEMLRGGNFDNTIGDGPGHGFWRGGPTYLEEMR